MQSPPPAELPIAVLGTCCEAEPTPPLAVMSQDSTRENTEEYQCSFQTEEDAVYFFNISVCTIMLQAVFVLCSSIIFCSSVMTHSPSNLDALLGVIDLLVVDATSASTVLLGNLCTHVYTASTATTEMCSRAFATLFIDIWLATILTMFFGGLYKLVTKDLHVQDFGLTLVEGLTSVRIFDVHQSPHAPHSLNMFAWPVLCIVIPAYLLPYTFRATLWMHETLHEAGVLFIILMCISGVLLVSIFASLHDESNIFYANASAVTYRTLEFNLGVNLYYLATINEPYTMSLMVFTERVRVVILAVYVCVWWAEFGIPVTQKQTCIRVYHFGSCINDHPGVLIRGCFLGACIVAWVTHVPRRLVEKCVSVWTVLAAQGVVLFSAPCFYILKGALIVSFGDSIVNANASLLSIGMPAVLYAAVWAYCVYMKPKIVHETVQIIRDLDATCAQSFGACCCALRGCRALVTRASAPRDFAAPLPG